MKTTFFFLLSLISVALGAMEFHQEFTATQRVSLRFDMGSEDQPHPATIFNLFPHIPKTSLIVLNNYTPVFHFWVQLISPYTKEPLGEKIFRRVQLTSNQPWFNDTFTTSSGITLSVATKISCARNFYGPTCDVFCDAHLAKVGRRRCDMMGRLRCDIGWMGPHCGHAVDPRKCACQNNGICVSGRVHNNSSAPLEESLICECTNGFTGEKCEVPAFTQFQFTAPKPDACSAKDACLNGAQCFPNGPKVYCSCPIGFIGEFCEIALSPQSPTIEPPPKTSGFSYTIYTVAGIFVFLALAAACFTYKIKPQRINALTRGQEPSPYAMPENRTKLIKTPETTKKVFTVEKEDRYTVAPTRTEPVYSVISKGGAPPVPTVSPPEIPHCYV